MWRRCAFRIMGVKGFIFGCFFILPDAEKRGALCRRLFENGIPFTEDKRGRLFIPSRCRKNAEAICTELGCSISECVNLPRIIYLNKRKYGVFAALAVCLFIFLFSMGRVWDIRVLGADETVEKALLDVLSEQGVEEGIRFSSFDLSETENTLKAACPSAAWVNLHRRGTVLYLNVLEKEGEGDESGVPLANIVASEDCVVVEVSPDRGVARVKVGDAVRAGELLISAVHTDGTLSGAAGCVLGRVSGSVSAVCKAEETSVTSKKCGVASVRINFFNFSFNIFKNYRNFANEYDIIEETKQLYLPGRISLPFSITTERVYATEQVQIHRSETDAVRIASVRLKQALSEILPLGELESLRTVGAWTEEGYLLTAEYVQIRDVSMSVPISLRGEK